MRFNWVENIPFCEYHGGIICLLVWLLKGKFCNFFLSSWILCCFAGNAFSWVISLMLHVEIWGAEPKKLQTMWRYLFWIFSYTFVLEVILQIANDVYFSYKSTSCESIEKAVKVAYCDNSEHNWDVLSHRACTCFGCSADTLTFQGINPKENLVSSLMLLLAVMTFL